MFIYLQICTICYIRKPLCVGNKITLMSCYCGLLFFLSLLSIGNEGTRWCMPRHWSKTCRIISPPPLLFSIHDPRKSFKNWGQTRLLQNKERGRSNTGGRTEKTGNKPLQENTTSSMLGYYCSSKIYRVKWRKKNPVWIRFENEKKGNIQANWG